MTPKKNDRHRIPAELIDQLLANYEKPDHMRDCAITVLVCRSLSVSGRWASPGSIR